MKQIASRQTRRAADDRVINALMSEIAERIEFSEQNNGLTNSAQWKLAAARAAEARDYDHLAQISEALADVRRTDDRLLLKVQAGILAVCGVAALAVGAFVYTGIAGSIQRERDEVRAAHERYLASMERDAQAARPKLTSRD